MGRLRHLWRFVNVQDFRRALSNPQKAVRVFGSVLRYSNAAREELDETASREDRRAFLTATFDTDPEAIDEHLQTLDRSEVTDQIGEATAFFEDKAFGIGGMQFNGETLYVLTRLLEPDTVLEIGVANGMSTAYLLGALEHAGKDGETDVYAVDRPLFESVVRERRGKAGLTGGIVPDEKEAGWIAPRSLRAEYGHQYYVGDFTEILDDVLDGIGSVNLVVYDASKDRAEMEWAYEQVIEALAPGGVLLSDDVLVNDAFESATVDRDGAAAVVHNSGLYGKPDR